VGEMWSKYIIYGLNILHVIHHHLRHINKLLIHIFCEYALTKKNGNEGDIVEILAKANKIDL
jgi:hypothetical protein